MSYRQIVEESNLPVSGEAPDARPEQRDIDRICYLTDAVQRAYAQSSGIEDARNLCYYRGQFWLGDGVAADLLSTWKDYVSQQNEVFPILDTVASALAIDTPQVEMLDQRVLSYQQPNRETDSALVGRRIAAPLNLFAEDDDLDESFHELVIHACLFRKGGTLKTTWSSDAGRVIFRPVLPWDIYWDPNAKRLSESEWIFERFPLHIEDLKKRIERGVYWQPRAVIAPDLFPRTVVEDYMPPDEVQVLREQGLTEHVLLHEWWDFRKGLVYHIHFDTRSVLFATRIPYGNPYVHLRFHFAVGRAEGIPLVSIIAPTQQEINELVSARKEIVRKLPRRMLYAKDLFANQEEADAWFNAKTTQPTPVNVPPDGDIAGRIFVTPSMDTTWDFNKHLSEGREHLRYEAGQADFLRGGVRNIRTAEEAKMVGAAVEGRMAKATNMVKKCATRTFRQALKAFQWAVENRAASHLDLEALHRNTQVDVDMGAWAREILEAAPKFRLLPFSPMMEDRIARRQSLNEVLTTVSGIPSMAAALNGTEALREVVELQGIRPSIVLPPPPPSPTSAAPAPEMGIPPLAEEGVIPGAPPLTPPVQ